MYFKRLKFTLYFYSILCQRLKIAIRGLLYHKQSFLLTVIPLNMKNFLNKLLTALYSKPQREFPDYRLVTRTVLLNNYEKTEGESRFHKLNQQESI